VILAGYSSEKELNQGKGGGYFDEAMMIDCKKSVCMIRGRR